eukprot:gene3299-3619_t
MGAAASKCFRREPQIPSSCGAPSLSEAPPTISSPAPLLMMRSCESLPDDPIPLLAPSGSAPSLSSPPPPPVQLLCSPASVTKPFLDEAVLHRALGEVYLLSERGLVSTIRFLLEAYPILEKRLNSNNFYILGDLSSDWTPLHVASAYGQDNVVSYYLSLPSVIPSVVDPAYNMTPLHLAVYFDQIYCIQRLCKDERADLGERTVEGKSALHLAIDKRSVLAVETILQSSSTVDYRIKDFDGNTLLHTAARSGSEGVLQLVANYINSVAFLFDPQLSPEDEIAIKRWHKKRVFYEGRNFQGQTAADILDYRVKELEEEMRRCSLSLKSDTSEFPSKECANTTLDTAEDTSTVKVDEVENEEIQSARRCLAILKEASFVPALFESLSSLGDHSNASASPQDRAEELTLDQVEQESSDDSSFHGNIALSWSPQNEIRFDTLRKEARDKLALASKLSCPLAYHID